MLDFSKFLKISELSWNFSEIEQSITLQVRTDHKNDVRFRLTEADYLGPRNSTEIREKAEIEGGLEGTRGSQPAIGRVHEPWATNVPDSKILFSPQNTTLVPILGLHQLIQVYLPQ